MKNGDYVIRERVPIRKLFTKKKVYKVIIESGGIVHAKDLKYKLHKIPLSKVRLATLREIREYYK